jgi:hypothetical protein
MPSRAGSRRILLSSGEHLPAPLDISGARGFGYAHWLLPESGSVSRFQKEKLSNKWAWLSI